MTHRLATNYAKNYCNRTLTVKVIVENVVTCFFGGHSVDAVFNVSVEGVVAISKWRLVSDAYRHASFITV